MFGSVVVDGEENLMLASVFQEKFSPFAAEVRYCNEYRPISTG
jgi:hypothetical protein